MTTSTDKDRGRQGGSGSGSTIRPSGSLLENLRQELARHAPFAQMAAADLDYFLSQASQQYFAPDETVVEPAQGEVKQLIYIRRGAVTGTRGLAKQMGGAFAYQAGDLFPLSAALAARAVTATYRATADTFVLLLPVAAVYALAKQSPVFADFLTQRSNQFLALSQKALAGAYAAHAMNEQSLEKPLGDMLGKAPVSCSPDTPLQEALQAMHQQRIGSMLVTDPDGQPVGILTRFDILGKITLAQLPLSTPIANIAVQPTKNRIGHVV